MHAYFPLYISLKTKSTARNFIQFCLLKVTVDHYLETPRELSVATLGKPKGQVVHCPLSSSAHEQLYTKDKKRASIYVVPLDCSLIYQTFSVEMSLAVWSFFVFDKRQ